MEISCATNKVSKASKGSADPKFVERLNARSALLVLFVALTIVLASTTVYESGTRTTLTSTSTATSTSTSTATSVSTTTSTTTQTTTVTSTFDLTKALTGAYLSHLGAIDSRNATALAPQYEANATLVYAIPYGVPPNGSFDGVANITGFLVQEPANYCFTCFDLKAPFAFANETHSMIVSSDDKAGNVTAHLLFWGVQSPGACYQPGVGSCVAGYFLMGFDISYVLQGDHWLISTERLTYGGGGGCTSASASPDGSVFHCEFNSA